MIPAFPNFKKIEVSDRSVVESFTHRYPPYSDFNFTSLWAWDTSGERMISVLNDNLVVRFTDYSTHEPFLSFLGGNAPEHSARELIDYAQAQGMPAELRLVPEISLKDVRPSVLNVQEDRNNFDYIYSVTALSALAGRSFSGPRKRANGFWRKYPGARVEVADLADKRVQHDIASVLRAWEKNKISGTREYELRHEEAAIGQLFRTANLHTLIVMGVFIDGVMRAFSIDEVLPGQYCIGHFWKADSTYPGIYDALVQKEAQHFETLGLAFWNCEQDLGIESLCRSKTSHRPVDFLKKYRVSLKNKPAEFHA